MFRKRLENLSVTAIVSAATYEEAASALLTKLMNKA